MLQVLKMHTQSRGKWNREKGTKKTISCIQGEPGFALRFNRKQSTLEMMLLLPAQICGLDRTASSRATLETSLPGTRDS